MSIETFKIGSLVDLEWRLGVAVKGSNCKNLGTPFVTVLIKVADSDKKIETHSFELTLSEFQVRITVYDRKEIQTFIGLCKKV
jgi:hypothetical protein